ncbi:hypothetical protein [Nocardia jiangxiensis]|uniref:hypothetical protein n=1 Tax=Nocardia jiangxiensis TaxID=282685 RepID=UPI0002DD51FF|nr:hypothetical protein [Nocardia jiangxiensis]
MATVPIQPTFTVNQAGITSATLNNIPAGVNFVYNGRPLLAVHDGGSGSTSLANQAWTRIVLGTVDIDNFSGWSTGSNTYTAPLTGYYMVMGCVVFSGQSNAGHSAATRFVINGTPVAGIGSHAYPSDGSSVPGVALSRMVFMAEKDILELQGFQDTGATVSTNNSGVSAERPYLDVIFFGG